MTNEENNVIFEKSQLICGILEQQFHLIICVLFNNTDYKGQLFIRPDLGLGSHYLRS